MNLTLQIEVLFQGGIFEDDVINKCGRVFFDSGEFIHCLYPKHSSVSKYSLVM